MFIIGSHKTAIISLLLYISLFLGNNIIFKQPENEKVEITPMKTEIIEVEEKKCPTEYEVAYQIWTFLRENGYSDHATAGIIGNCMAEAGGNTLNIIVDINTNYYAYGICQWHMEYYPEVFHQDLEFQLNFLLDTIEDAFDYCGEMFGCTFEEFKKIDDERLAAKHFCQIYERPECNTYTRQDNAEIAYKYFIELERKR